MCVSEQCGEPFPRSPRQTKRRFCMSRAPYIPDCNPFCALILVGMRRPDRFRALYFQLGSTLARLATQVVGAGRPGYGFFAVAIDTTMRGRLHDVGPGAWQTAGHHPLQLCRRRSIGLHRQVLHRHHPQSQTQCSGFWPAYPLFPNMPLYPLTQFPPCNRSFGTTTGLGRFPPNSTCKDPVPHCPLQQTRRLLRIPDLIAARARAGRRTVDGPGMFRGNVLANVEFRFPPLCRRGVYLGSGLNLRISQQPRFCRRRPV